MKAINLVVLPVLALSGVAAAAVVTPRHGPDHIHHKDLANRTDGNTHWKRFSNSRWTFYDVGLGACGKTNVPSDFIVALNAAQFGGGYPGPHCFQKIKMTYKGKTTTAQITDQCPGCPYGGLDLSRGLFDFFADEDLGVIAGEWSFTDGGDDGDDGHGGGGGGHDDPPKHTTTTKPHTSSSEHSTTAPTTTSEHTSSKHEPTTTTTSKAPTSTPTPTSTSTVPSATGTAVADNPANLNKFVSLLDALSGLVVAGSQFD